MAPVDFKKRQCPLSLLLEFLCRFKNSPMSSVDFKKGQCPLSLFFLLLSVDFKRVQCRLSNLRKGRVALSNLRVNGPQLAPSLCAHCRSPRVVISSHCRPQHSPLPPRAGWTFKDGGARVEHVALCWSAVTGVFTKPYLPSRPDSRLSPTRLYVEYFDNY